MPIINSLYNDEYTRIVCWHLTESDEDLLDYLQLSPYRIMKYLTLNPKQAREYLGLRACLKVLGLDFEVYYNQKGKPYLPASRQLSISHSFDMVCIGLSQYYIGVDIEKERTEKILNIENKFIRHDEQEWIPEENKGEYLHIIWGIKEGLYKLNGGKLWNFLKHYKVEAFELKENQAIICWLWEDNERKKYSAYYQKLLDYYLVWVLDENTETG
ncbi:MAG: 4'-phosphopantetheinyl transferase superfamily protein [Weeksellaceae bacterium]|jgi:phosphopantetheinyl transferase|nr:4'-phosphopantetheinyl transferase superfamily protein [Weeksellaceae bacterium]